MKHDLTTPRREQQLATIQKKVEEWYWHAVENRPQRDEGESHTLKLEIWMADSYDHEALFQVVVKKAENTSL